MIHTGGLQCFGIGQTSKLYIGGGGQGGAAGDTEAGTETGGMGVKDRGGKKKELVEMLRNWPMQ